MLQEVTIYDKILEATITEKIMKSKPEANIAKILMRNKKTLTVTESCTGGLISHRLTNISGSSTFFKLGIVVYSNKAKNKILKVPNSILLKYGAVSKQVAQKMAQEARKILNTDYVISITGIAGPTGGTKNKPIGLTYIAISTKRKTCCYRYIFKGNRTKIKSLSATKALTLLNKHI